MTVAGGRDATVVGGRRAGRRVFAPLPVPTGAPETAPGGPLDDVPPRVGTSTGPGADDRGTSAPGHPGRGDVVDLGWVVAVVRDRATTVLAVAGVVAAVVGVLALLRPVTWTAAAEVVVRPVTVQPFSVSSSGVDRAVSMPTEVAVATGRRLAAAVAGDLGVPDSPGFRAGLRVTAEEGAQVLDIAYTAASPTAAADRANRFAAAYLAARAASAEAVADQQRAAFDDRTAALTVRRASLVEQVQIAVAAATDPVEAAPLAAPVQSQIDAVDRQLADLDTARVQLAGLDVSGGQLLGPTGAGDAVGDRWGARTVALAALGGLLPGVVLALLLERRRPRVRGTDGLGGPATPVVAIPSVSLRWMTAAAHRRRSRAARALRAAVTARTTASGGAVVVVPTSGGRVAHDVAGMLRIPPDRAGPITAGDRTRVGDPFDPARPPAESALVVVHGGRTTVREVDEVLADLAGGATPVLAIVLVDRRAR